MADTSWQFTLDAARANIALMLAEKLDAEFFDQFFDDSDEWF